MKTLDAQTYLERWKAVAEIERKALQSATPAEKWRRLNAIRQRAVRLGVTRDDDDGEMEVFLLWARLRAGYGQS